MWPLCLISTSHAREPCLSRITQNSECSSFEFGYLGRCLKKNIHSDKHGTKANIRSTKMANNRHAYNRDVLQSYWTSEPVLFEYGTGCEWHTSNQTLQCPVVTIRCYPWSAGFGQVFHIVGLCVFSHQWADYSIVVAHLTSNSFEGHPCCMHVDYLPSLCFWYSPSYHAYWEWIHFLKHRT
jgi:hypothetical protein